MKEGCLESIFIEVHPGLAVPAEAADFVFNRLEWIRQGEEGPFPYVAPLPWEFHDLCTLAYFVANNEISAAHDLVRNLVRPPSILLPSATETTANNNHLRANPFRRRRKKRAASCSPRQSQVCKPPCFLAIMGTERMEKLKSMLNVAGSC